MTKREKTAGKKAKMTTALKKEIKWAYISNLYVCVYNNAFSIIIELDVKASTLVALSSIANSKFLEGI